MTAPHHDPVRAALQRLATSPSGATDRAPLPLLLRAPSLTALWALLLLTGVATLALARVRLPGVTAGVVVAVARAHSRSVEILLLFPPSSRDHVTPGTLVTVDTGGTHPLTLSVTHVERSPLDERAARTRFESPATVLPHLGTPRAVAHLACSTSGCLTLHGTRSYRATVAVGMRTIASYVMPRS
jgi:hypothetical protein